MQPVQPARPYRRYQHGNQTVRISPSRCFRQYRQFLEDVFSLHKALNTIANRWAPQRMPLSVSNSGCYFSTLAAVSITFVLHSARAVRVDLPTEVAGGVGFWFRCDIWHQSLQLLTADLSSTTWGGGCNFVACRSAWSFSPPCLYFCPLLDHIVMLLPEVEPGTGKY